MTNFSIFELTYFDDQIFHVCDFDDESNSIKQVENYIKTKYNEVDMTFTKIYDLTCLLLCCEVECKTQFNFIQNNNTLYVISIDDFDEQSSYLVIKNKSTN